MKKLMFNIKSVFTNFKKQTEKPVNDISISIEVKRRKANLEFLGPISITVVVLGSVLLLKQFMAPGSTYGTLPWKCFVSLYGVFILAGLILMLIRHVNDPYSIIPVCTALFITAITALISSVDGLISSDMSALVAGLIAVTIAYRSTVFFHFIRSFAAIVIYITGNFILTGEFLRNDRYIILAAFMTLSFAVALVLERYANNSFRLQAESEALNLQLRDLSLKDRLTGLYNRYFLDETLEYLFMANKRQGSVFTIMMVDVDHFKSVNDVFGHMEGDRTLCAIAETLKRVTRGNDIVGRFGGEEFLIILPNTGIPGAIIVAENILDSVRRLGSDLVPRAITVSAGLAEYRTGEELKQILERADRMLYKAKNNGRNRFEAEL